MKYGNYFGEREVEEAKPVCVISDADARRLFGTDVYKRQISQAERSRTSWPQWLTEIRPLFPEPFARKEKRLICCSN